VAYVSVDRFKLLSVMPDTDVDELLVAFPGFLEAKLDTNSAWIDARLRKRYKAPFAEPITGVIEDWLVRMVTPVAYAKRGWDAAGVDTQAIIEDGDAARAEVLEAANGENGLFELTLNDAQDASGVSKQATRGYSEQSPYVGFSRQARTGRDEDESGEGSSV
jgi:hypothetical protein